MLGGDPLWLEVSFKVIQFLNFTGSILFLHLSYESVVFFDDVVDVARSLTIHRVILGWCLKVELDIVLSRDGHCSDNDFRSARDACSADWASLESWPQDTVLTEHMTTVQGELGAGVVGAQRADDCCQVLNVDPSREGFGRSLFCNEVKHK